MFRDRATAVADRAHRIVMRDAQGALSNARDYADWLEIYHRAFSNALVDPEPPYTKSSFPSWWPISDGSFSF